MLGTVFLHLIPESIEINQNPVITGFYTLLGIFLFFILEKIIHQHKHYLPDEIESFGIMNLVGDVFHNFIDGIAIGASYLISIPLGISTSFAIALHEVPKEFSDFVILLHAGFSAKKAFLFNFFSAFSAILGTVLVFYLKTIFHQSLDYLVPFTAGTFIYIAASSLIPELHKEQTTYKVVLQSLFFALGMLTMLGLRLV